MDGWDESNNKKKYRMSEVHVERNMSSNLCYCGVKSYLDFINHEI